MALTSGIAARSQPALPAALATILSPLVPAPAKPAANTGPGVNYVPSIPPAAAAPIVPTPLATPAATPTVPDVSYAPSIPLPAAVTSPVNVATPAVSAIAPPVAAAVPLPAVSYAPSLIAPATIVPAAIPETIVAVTPTPVAAVVAPVLLPSEPAAPPPRDEVAEPVAAAPVQDAPPPAATSSTGTSSTSGATATPSLLALYRDATRTTEAHALAGFALSVPTVAPTPTSAVRTGAELIADAAYTLVAGAGTNRAGIAMLLDSTGAQASEESNRRTPEAKKPSVLAA